MGKKQESVGSEGLAAYHDGPPEIEFAGRHWRLGTPNPIDRAGFEALQQRPDAQPFDFRFETNNTPTPADLSTREAIPTTHSPEDPS